MRHHIKIKDTKDPGLACELRMAFTYATDIDVDVNHCRILAVDEYHIDVEFLAKCPAPREEIIHKTLVVARFYLDMYDDADEDDLPGFVYEKTLSIVAKTWDNSTVELDVCNVIEGRTMYYDGFPIATGTQDRLEGWITRLKIARSHLGYERFSVST